MSESQASLTPGKSQPVVKEGTGKDAIGSTKSDRKTRTRN